MLVRDTATVSRITAGEKDSFGRSSSGTEIIFTDAPFVQESLVQVSDQDPDRPGFYLAGKLLLPSEYHLNQGDIVKIASGTFKLSATPLRYREGLQQLSVIQIR